MANGSVFWMMEIFREILGCGKHTCCGSQKVVFLGERELGEEGELLIPFRGLGRCTPVWCLRVRILRFTAISTPLTFFSAMCYLRFAAMSHFGDRVQALDM